MKWLHSKKEFTPEMLTEDAPTALIRETFNVLNQPISLIKDLPEEFTNAINQNTWMFSGYKVLNALNDASLSLVGEDGNFKPFKQFLNDVLNIDNTYNKAYLQAEYNLAVQSTQMAQRWKEFEADGDKYNLQYRTAQDERVRDEHASLHNITLPLTDPFWNSYLPPNGWNCRCTVVQVLKDKYPASNSADSITVGNLATDHPKLQMFRFNPGKQAKIFPDKHPYFKADKKAADIITNIKKK